MKVESSFAEVKSDFRNQGQLPRSRVPAESSRSAQRSLFAFDSFTTKDTKGGKGSEMKGGKTEEWGGVHAELAEAAE